MKYDRSKKSPKQFNSFELEIFSLSLSKPLAPLASPLDVTRQTPQTRPGWRPEAPVHFGSEKERERERERKGFYPLFKVLKRLPVVVALRPIQFSKELHDSSKPLGCHPRYNILSKLEKVDISSFDRLPVQCHCSTGSLLL